ncbi:hypothetical protein ACSMX9_22600 [Streptomyces sp. LE64]|uniref:hypothetical protein n=1 Tax=Streptomyces sp. LE64 TaxID=3448653 RepID=UPI00404225CB
MLLRRYHTSEDEPPHPPPSGDEDGTGPGDTERPARSAPRADWLAYAARQDPADHSGLTKAELIEQYGG